MDNEEFNADEWLRSFWPIEWEAAEPQAPYGQPQRPRNPVVDETFQMASRVMDYSEALEKRNATFADQILRSGTSVGSHTREAQGAESLADFQHKMKIAHKELEETDYRLDLCHLKPHYPLDRELVAQTKRLFPLFNSILATTRLRINEKKR